MWPAAWVAPVLLIQKRRPRELASAESPLNELPPAKNRAPPSSARSPTSLDV
jgi:hypothetical protein